MAPRKKKSNRNTSPPEVSMFPKGVFAFAQCAHYSVEQYTHLLCKEQNISQRDVEEALSEFGGVRGFLQYAVDQKTRYETAMGTEPGTFIGREPAPNELQSRAYFAGWGFGLRVWGYGDNTFKFLQTFVFDFIDTQGRHIKTPHGLTIKTVNYEPGTEIFSVQQSMARSLDGIIGKDIANASEDIFGTENYVVLHGTVLQFDYQYQSIQIELPRHTILPLPFASLSNPSPAAAFSNSSPFAVRSNPYYR